MATRLSLVPLVAPGARAEHSTRWVWTAVGALTISGLAHLVAATTLDAYGLLQLVVLGAALAQFAPAGFLGSLALAGQRPSGAVAGALLAGAVGLVALALRLPSPLGAGEATLADVLVAAAVIGLLTGVWRRRAQYGLMALAALTWALWLVGVGVTG